MEDILQEDRKTSRQEITGSQGRGGGTLLSMIHSISMLSGFKDHGYFGETMPRFGKKHAIHENINVIFEVLGIMLFTLFTHLCSVIIHIQKQTH